MHAHQAYQARSRKLDERVLGKGALVQPPPHKERALWNFLTWSFFIAQVLTAEQFIGAQAKAAGNLDLGLPGSSAAEAMPKSDWASLENAASTPDDVRQSLGGSLDDLSFQSLKLGQFGGTVIDLDSLSVARVEDVSQSISVAGGGTDAGLSLTGDTPGDLLPTSVVDVVLPDILGVVGDVTGPLLDTVEDIVATLTGIVGGITDPLLDTVGSVVHVVDNVLEPVTELVADITQPLGDVVQEVLDPVADVVASLTAPLGDVVQDVLNPVTDVVAKLTDPLSEVAQDVLNPLTDVVADLTEPLGEVVHDVLAPVTALLGITDDLAGTTQDVVASAGELTLPVFQLAGLDDLYGDGRYTDYGIEVHANVTVSTAAIAGSAASAVSTATEAVDNVIDTATRPLDDAGRHLAHLLDDLGPGSLDRLL